MVYPTSLLGPLGLALLGILPAALGCTNPVCRSLEILVSLLLVFWIGWHRSQVIKLQHWFAAPDNVLPPEASGEWEELFSIGYRWRKREEQQRHKLRQTLEQLQQAMDALPDALLLLDRRGEMLWGNRSTATLLGLQWPMDRGQSLNHLVRHPRFRAFIDQGGAGTLQIPSPVAPQKTLEVNRFPLPQGDSLMAFRDVSRLLQLEQMRRDFVANVSHELRSPITVLAGFIETLQDTPGCAEGEAASYLELMEQQTTRMQSLVANLLTLARLESEALPRHHEPVLMSGLIRQTLGALQEQSQNKVLSIEFELDDSLYICAEIVDLTSIVRNLIENAISYTNAGERIRVSWTYDPDGAVFAVEDNGPGIAAEHLPRLTERFYRVDKGRARDSGGTGLGLSIVKHAAARYDACLQIESQPGLGSTFRVHFPKAHLCHGEVPD